MSLNQRSNPSSFVGLARLRSRETQTESHEEFMAESVTMGHHQAQSEPKRGILSLPKVVFPEGLPGGHRQDRQSQGAAESGLTKSHHTSLPSAQPSVNPLDHLFPGAHLSHQETTSSIQTTISAGSAVSSASGRPQGVSPAKPEATGKTQAAEPVNKTSSDAHAEEQVRLKQKLYQLFDYLTEQLSQPDVDREDLQFRMTMLKELLTVEKHLER